MAVPWTRFTRRNSGKYFRLGDQIERAGSLVGDNQLRPVKDGHSDQHTLRHTDAKLVRVQPQKTGFCWKIDILQCLPDLARTDFAVLVDAPRLRQLRLDTQPWIEGLNRTLQHQRDLLASDCPDRCCRLPEEVNPVKKDTACHPCLIGI